MVRRNTAHVGTAVLVYVALSTPRGPIVQRADRIVAFRLVDQ